MKRLKLILEILTKSQKTIVYKSSKGSYKQSLYITIYKDNQVIFSGVPPVCGYYDCSPDSSNNSDRAATSSIKKWLEKSYSDSTYTVLTEKYVRMFNDEQTHITKRVISIKRINSRLRPVRIVEFVDAEGFLWRNQGYDTLY